MKFAIFILFIFISFSHFSPVDAHNPELRLNFLRESPFLYREYYDILNDIEGCPSYSEAGIDRCFIAIQHRFEPKLGRLDQAILSKAQTRLTDLSATTALILSGRRAARAYKQLRLINCDRLSHAAAGGTMHRLRQVHACQFWMDLHRRSLLQETAGKAPMQIKPGRGGPHGPYRLTDIWRLAGAGADRLSKLKSQEATSLRRLASARRRVRRVLDDWDEWQDFVDIADRDFRQSGPAFVRYRRAQCDDYTPKLTAALGPTPTPEEAATACRILVNIEQATLLRYDFEDQPLMSRERKPGESRNRR